MTQHSGDGGGNLETRLAKLESDVKNINSNLILMWDDLVDFRKDVKTDFHLLWVAFNLSLFGIVAILAKGFGWL